MNHLVFGEVRNQLFLGLVHSGQVVVKLLENFARQEDLLADGPEGLVLLLDHVDRVLHVLQHLLASGLLLRLLQVLAVNPYALQLRNHVRERELSALQKHHRVQHLLVLLQQLVHVRPEEVQLLDANVVALLLLLQLPPQLRFRHLHLAFFARVRLALFVEPRSQAVPGSRGRSS